eukprot:TRINITY_DN3387_c0_g1_i12.p1 TRINITY_DN3387_c0_g1~~TRINITY_DN3387_c0_g1_i12.p1  ORF type:complete len:490 (-),score=107.13 TRINITY_DN3387_c0_g1_i12:362-1831(-)
MLTRLSQRFFHIAHGRKHVVLVGGGHANCLVLKELASKLHDTVKVTLISENTYSFYSGMLPGCINQQYFADEITVFLEPVARYFGIDYVFKPVKKINTARNELVLQDDTTIEYDYLSVDIGSRTRGTYAVKGVHESAITTRPINKLLTKIERMEWKLRSQGIIPKVVISGGGAAGVELAFNFKTRWERYFNCKLDVSLMHEGDNVLPGFRDAMRDQITQILKEKDIKVINNAKTREITSQEVLYQDTKSGSTLSEKADVVIWATGAEGHNLLKESNFDCDPLGFAYVNNNLQIDGHPNIFAGGDCINMRSYSGFPPKAGVYAVREGPVIANNLGAQILPEKFKMSEYVPQKEFLCLINTGDGKSCGGKFGVSMYGKWVMELKDYIDRQFMNMFNPKRIFTFYDNVSFLRREVEELVDHLDMKESAEERKKAYAYTPEEAAQRLLPRNENDKDLAFKDRMYIIERMNVEPDFHDKVLKKFGEFRFVQCIH